MRTTSESLRVETTQLVTALRRPEARGRGARPRCAARSRPPAWSSTSTSTSRSPSARPTAWPRPDLVVHLAGGKHVVVDSKVSFIGVLEANEARDDTVRGRAAQGARPPPARPHRRPRPPRRTGSSSSRRPSSSCCSCRPRPSSTPRSSRTRRLLERGFEKNVVIATPATLVALLRTVAYTWRQEALAKNAQEVFTLGKELHGRLATMGDEFAKLGNALSRSVDAYNKTVGSLESRVLVSARKLAELHLAETELEAPAPARDRAARAAEGRAHRLRPSEHLVVSCSSARDRPVDRARPIADRRRPTAHDTLGPQRGQRA